MRKIGLLLGFALMGYFAQSQGYAFGVKGGLTVGIQDWSGLEQDPLLKYHGIAFIETLSDDNAFALFAQLGYHVKGSAQRNRRFISSITNQIFQPSAREFKFNNLSLTLGGKQKFDFTGSTKVYYAFGIRVDYTVSTNLDEYTDFNLRNPAYAIYPFDEPTFINEFNYGIYAGGGFEIPFGELTGMILEFSINPDFSLQYRQPPIQNVTDPYTGNERTLSERKIRNITFEVTAGFRFLNVYEYID